LDIKSNESRVPKSRTIQALFFRNRRLLRRAKTSLPNQLRPLATRAWGVLERLNVRGVADADRNPALREVLKPRFGEVVDRVEDLVGRDLTSWRA
jgi:hypothetical protein